MVQPFVFLKASLHAQLIKIIHPIHLVISPA